MSLCRLNVENGMDVPLFKQKYLAVQGGTLWF